jgi:hypothetical protein
MYRNLRAAIKIELRRNSNASKSWQKEEERRQYRFPFGNLLHQLPMKKAAINGMRMTNK